jgi:hypothetical protein
MGVQQFVQESEFLGLGGVRRLGRGPLQHFFTIWSCVSIPFHV